MFVRLCWKSLPGSNTLAYFIPFKPWLMFVSRSGAYLSLLPFMYTPLKLLSLPINIRLGWKNMNKHSSLLWFVNYSSKKFLKHGDQESYSQPIFFKLTNRPNKLECCITQGWIGFAVSNTLVYWAHSKLRRK